MPLTQAATPGSSTPPRPTPPRLCLLGPFRTLTLPALTPRLRAAALILKSVSVCPFSSGSGLGEKKGPFFLLLG